MKQGKFICREAPVLLNQSLGFTTGKKHSNFTDRDAIDLPFLAKLDSGMGQEMCSPQEETFNN